MIYVIKEQGLHQNKLNSSLEFPTVTLKWAIPSVLMQAATSWVGRASVTRPGVNNNKRKTVFILIPWANINTYFTHLLSTSQ